MGGEVCGLYVPVFIGPSVEGPAYRYGLPFLVDREDFPSFLEALSELGLGDGDRLARIPRHLPRNPERRGGAEEQAALCDVPDPDPAGYPLLVRVDPADDPAPTRGVRGDVLPGGLRRRDVCLTTRYGRPQEVREPLDRVTRGLKFRLSVPHPAQNVHTPSP